jgi:hypothetical protein
MNSMGSGTISPPIKVMGELWSVRARGESYSLVVGYNQSGSVAHCMYLSDVWLSDDYVHVMERYVSQGLLRSSLTIAGDGTILKNKFPPDCNDVEIMKTKINDFMLMEQL